MANRLVKLTVINDFVCPNCAIGQHELFSAITHCKEDLKLPLAFQIEFRPFRLLNPSDLPSDYEPKVTKSELFGKKFGAAKFSEIEAAISRWAVEKGVPLSFEGIASQSTRAHRLSRKALLMGGMKLQLPFLIAIFRVHLQEGKDIADIDVLSDVAAEVGIMTKEQATAFLKSDELEAEVDNMCEEARAKGVTGIPFVIIDSKWVVSGGQSSDVFVQIFKKLAGVHVANALPASFTTLVPTPAPLIA